MQKYLGINNVRMEPLLLLGRNNTKVREETIKHEGRKKKERNYTTVKTNLNRKFKTIFTLRQSFD